MVTVYQRPVGVVEVKKPNDGRQDAINVLWESSSTTCAKSQDGRLPSGSAATPSSFSCLMNLSLSLSLSSMKGRER